MATGGTAFSAVSGLNGVASPSFVNSAGATSALATVMTNIGPFLVSLVSVVFLWSPTVFAGNFVWFWEYVCFRLQSVLS